MGRVVYLLFFVGISIVRAAPKVQEASFSNLLEVHLFSFDFFYNFQLLNLFQAITDENFTRDVGESDRSNNSLEGKLEQYVKSHQISFEVPLTGSTVTLGGKNLDNDELDLTIKLESKSELEGKIINLLEK